MVASRDSLVMSTCLDQHVLVLNRLWQAVNICTAKRALTLLFEGRAQVVVDGGDIEKDKIFDNRYKTAAAGFSLRRALARLLRSNFSWIFGAAAGLKPGAA